MKLIFFGTSDFALPSLKKIIESKHEICAVVTQPDRKKGRRLVVTPPPVKAAVSALSFPIHQPVKASSPESLKALRRYDADLFVVVEFGQILKKELLEMPRIFCVNLHASILPKYRGAAPINWSIMNGDEKTGVTTMKMNEKMDCGDIIDQEEVPIRKTDDCGSLKKRLSEKGGDLLLNTINDIEAGSIDLKKQDEGKASFAPKLKKEDGLIDWSKGAKEINNRVRGLSPWPSAYTHFKGKLLKIWKSEFRYDGSRYDAGEINGFEGDAILVCAGKGVLVIKELQLEGGKRLGSGVFLRGHKLNAGDRFE